LSVLRPYRRERDARRLDEPRMPHIASIPCPTYRDTENEWWASGAHCIDACRILALPWRNGL